MIKVVLDWETAYGKHPVTQENITLSKMTTEEYVRHPKFKVHGLGVKIGKDRAFYLHNPKTLAAFLKSHPWDKSFVIAHHTHFDGAILSWRCGIRPAFWGCTLSMARAIFPHEFSSLANVAKLLGVGEKGHELVNFIHKWVLTDEEQQVLGSYCRNDVELTSDIFDALKKHFPVSELRLIDWTIRAFTEPVIQVDPVPLVRAYINTRRQKRALIKQCVTDKTVLASSEKFAALLLSVGVDPPKKLSPSKVKDGRVDPDEVGDPPIGLLPSFKALTVNVQEKLRLRNEKSAYPWAYAFGKADESFKLLQSHPDLRVQALVEARLGVKSTITETRTKRYYKIGKRGAFPVYLNYYGAHTNRWSGGDKQNAQNLSRVDADDPESGALRKSWMAPPRHVIDVRDLGQIEARMLVYWAGQEDMVDMFRAGGDPYCFMATKIYGRDITKADKKERSIGKLTVLGCGYQMGWAKFQESIRVGFMGMAGILFDQSYVDQLGVDVEAFRYQRSYRKGHQTCESQALAMKPLNLSDEEQIMHCAVTKHLIDTFRSSNEKVIALWNAAKNSLTFMLAGMEAPVGERPLVTATAEGYLLPNGMKIRYSRLRKNDAGEFKYLANARKKEWTKLYAGKCVENVVQGLSRLVISDQKLNIISALRKIPTTKGEILKVVTSTHDEIVVVSPERLADQVLEIMKIEMATAPAWCADLPLKSSGGYARSYGDVDK